MTVDALISGAIGALVLAGLGLFLAIQLSPKRLDFICSTTEIGKHKPVDLWVSGRPWWSWFRKIYYIPCRSCAEIAYIFPQLKERKYGVRRD